MNLVRGDGTCMPSVAPDVMVLYSLLETHSCQNGAGGHDVPIPKRTLFRPQGIGENAEALPGVRPQDDGRHQAMVGNLHGGLG